MVHQLMFSSNPCTGACWESCSLFVHTLLMDGVLKESGCFNGVFIIEKPTGRSSRVRRSNILKAQIMVKVTERHGADGELL